MTMPKIVCLCGSTRFYEAFQEANFYRTLAGQIVLSVGFYPHAADKAHAAHEGVTPAMKEELDVLHFRKIDLSSEIFVLNVGGYIGASTAREIAYAIFIGRGVVFLEPAAGETFLEEHSRTIGRMVARFASGPGEIPPLPTLMPARLVRQTFDEYKFEYGLDHGPGDFIDFVLTQLGAVKDANDLRSFYEAKLRELAAFFPPKT